MTLSGALLLLTLTLPISDADFAGTPRLVDAHAPDMAEMAESEFDTWEDLAEMEAERRTRATVDDLSGFDTSGFDTWEDVLGEGQSGAPIIQKTIMTIIIIGACVSLIIGLRYLLRRSNMMQDYIKKILAATTIWIMTAFSFSFIFDWFHFSSDRDERFFGFCLLPPLVFVLSLLLVRWAWGPLRIPAWITRQTSLLVVGIFVTTPASAATFTGAYDPVDADSGRLAGEKIRLSGIDAPEMRQACTLPNGSTWLPGREGRAWLLDYLGGREITCEASGKGRYGRWIVTCATPDGGGDLGEEIVRAGWAYDYPKYSKGRYAAAESEARAAGRGVWRGECAKPWEWRRQSRN